MDLMIHFISISAGGETSQRTYKAVREQLQLRVRGGAALCAGDAGAVVQVGLLCSVGNAGLCYEVFHASSITIRILPIPVILYVMHMLFLSVSLSPSILSQ